MIKTVFSAGLPVSERLLVRKNRLQGTGGPGPRIAIVTGIHGDELEGQYVAFRLTRLLEDHLESLRGTVDIYPALNPLGISASNHGVPRFDIDLDHTFPGNKHGTLTEALAAAIVSDIRGARVCIDIRSSDPRVHEIPHAHIDRDRMQQLAPLARLLNTELVWAHSPKPVEKSSLVGTLNALGTWSMTVRMGEPMRVSEAGSSWLAEGILRVLEHLGSWPSSSILLPIPRVIFDADVEHVRAERAGVFLPSIDHGTHVERGQELGIVTNTLTCEVLESVVSPCNGLLMSLREYPVIYPGSLLARIVRDQQWERRQCSGSRCPSASPSSYEASSSGRRTLP